MATKFLDKTGLSHFWSKIKTWCSSTFAAIAHTHTSYAVKHSYTTAANAAKNWYRIANANTSQTDTIKPIHAQFILTAYNTSYDAGYYERWFVNAGVFGRTGQIIVFGSSVAPFSQARVLYEYTLADLDANDRPAIDIYLNYQLANGTTKIEIEEVYNSGWTFVNDGQISVSSVPTGFENQACSVRGNGVERSTYADYAPYLNRQVSNFTAAFTLADSYLYRSRTLNCTGTFTITVPSINSGYMWCVIKNKNTSSGVITLHPSTTSVLIDGSNADIPLQPMEYVCIHSVGANNYSLIADGRWKSQKADKATTLAGYGITDAKIANGTITLGSNSITPLTSHQTLPTLSRTISGSGNAITDITVSNHAITATKGSTFLTSASTLDATKLSGTIPSSCYTDTTYTAGTGLSLTGTEFSLASHAHNKLLSAGDNVASTSTNTYASGYFNVRWFSEANKVPGQPSQYGFLVTFATGDNVAEVHQIWCTQDNGDLYHRGTNSASYTSPPAFKKIIDSSNDALIPVGAIIYYAKSTVPSGFLICNGGEVSRTTYAALFNVIGTIYGAGNGSSTFNVPNLIGRFPEGSATPGTVHAAGLPNITGYFESQVTGLGGTIRFGYGEYSGCCYPSGVVDMWRGASTGEHPNDKQSRCNIDASKSNAIYGKSSTVQPPALTLVPCIRYA